MGRTPPALLVGEGIPSTSSLKSLDKILEDWAGHDLMSADGFEDCLVGVVERYGSQPCLCYDKGLMIKKMVDHGMSEEEALEFFDFNIIGAWVGDNTPCFIST